MGSGTLGDRASCEAGSGRPQVDAGKASAFKAPNKASLTTMWQLALNTKSFKLILTMAVSAILLLTLFYCMGDDREASFSATVRGAPFTVTLELNDEWKVVRSRTPARPDSVSLAEVSMGDQRVFVMVGAKDSPLLLMLTSLPLDEDAFELKTNSALFPAMGFSSRGGLLAASAPLRSPLDSNINLVIILSGSVADRERALELVHSIDFEFGQH